MLVLFMAVAVTTLSLTVFFKTETVAVSGNTRYAEQEIIDKSGIKIGENLIMLNTQNAVESLKREFVYIENVRLKKDIFKGEAQIIIEEAVPFCTLKESDGSYLLISRGGTVLERLLEQPSEMYSVIGLNLENSRIGTTLSGDGSEQLQVLEEIYSAMESTGISGIINIDVSDTLNIVINYDNRVNVEFGTRTELEYKMKYAKEILETKIQPYERGTLDVSYCHTTPNAVFTPDREAMEESAVSSEQE